MTRRCCGSCRAASLHSWDWGRRSSWRRKTKAVRQGSSLTALLSESRSKRPSLFLVQSPLASGWRLNKQVYQTVKYYERFMKAKKGIAGKASHRGEGAAKCQATSARGRELTVQMTQIKNGLVREFGLALGGH